MESGKQYESSVKVLLDASAVHGAAEKMKGDLDKVRGSVHKFRDSIKETGKSMAMMGLGAVGFGFGFGAVAHKILDANMELDAMGDQIAGTLYAFRQWREGVDESLAIDRSIEDAAVNVEKLEKISTRMAIGAQDVAWAYQNLAGPALQTFGRSEADLMRLTEGATAAMTVFQRPATEVTAIIRNLLENKRLSKADPLSVKLRSFLGDAKAIKAMNPQELFDKTALALEKLGPAADKLTADIDGQMFRLKKSLTETIRGAGGATMTYLGERVQKLNEYLSETNESGKTVAQVWGDRILSGVKKVEKVLMFVKDNWKAIAMVVAAIKIAPLVETASAFAGVLGGALKTAGALGGALGAAGGAGAAGAKGLHAIVGQLGGAVNVAVIGLGALAAAATLFANWVDKKQDERLKRNADVGDGMGEASMRMSKANFGAAREQTRKMLGALERTKLMSGPGQLSPNLASDIQHLPDSERRSIAKNLGVGEGKMSPAMHSAMIAETFRKRFEDRKKWFPELFTPKQAPPPLPSVADLTKPQKPVMNWNQYGPIQLNQEFKEADPDNVYLRFREDVESQASNRITSSLMETFAS